MAATDVTSTIGPAETHEIIGQGTSLATRQERRGHCDGGLHLGLQPPRDWLTTGREFRRRVPGLCVRRLH